MSKAQLIPNVPKYGIQLFLDFINKLEGWKTRCKNLHWAASKNNIHVRLDEFLDILSKYQDSIAEGIMGVLNVHFKPDDVNGVQCNASNAYDLVSQITEETLKYYEKIPSNSIYAGLKSECETFINSVTSYNYLFSLCDGYKND